MMLSALKTALRRLIYEHGRVSPDEVALRFERPTRVWVESLERPTLNWFCYAMDENSDFRNATPQTSRAAGRAITRMPPRRVDLRYLVAAFSTIADDEQRLLWRTMATLLRYGQLPPDLLSGPARELDLPVALKVGSYADAPRPLDIWGALEVSARPALLCTVTAPLDLDVEFDAPLVLSRELRFRRRGLADEAAERPITREDALPDRDLYRIGGTLHTNAGQPVSGARVAVAGRAIESRTDSNGRYALGPLPGGELTLHVTIEPAMARSFTLLVPADSYDLIIDDHP